MIVIVNPQTSGYRLSEAFQEAGVDCLHLYTEPWPQRRAADTLSPYTAMHHDLPTTLAALTLKSPLAVLPGSHWGIELADELAARLGLPHNDRRLATARTDKAAMVTAVERQGIATPPTFAVRNPTDLAAALAAIGSRPVVLKHVSTAGSVGCLRCDGRASAVAAFGELHGQRNRMGRPNDRILVQPYLPGPQFAVNTVSSEGRHLVTEFYEQHYDWTSDRPSSRHLLLRRYLDPRDRQVVAYVERCLDAVGQREGAAHTEVRITPEGPLLIEVNCRLMGEVHTDPYFAAIGYSHPAILAERYLDPQLFTTRLDRAYRAQRSLARVYLRTGGNGRLSASPGLGAIRRLPGFHSLVELPRRGAQVSPSNLSILSTGGAYFVHDDEQTVRDSLATVFALHVADGVFRTDTATRESATAST
ncbi:hypothetical protein OK074_7622 [Actinobacteria bacterium OK074]|nr:hypothetical protein OK074_7622 [Actinobacteria bacterium OK074]